MRILTALPAALLLLSACGGDGETTASDAAGGSGGDSNAAPTHIPAAPGPVRTLSIATVLDRDEPVLCLGPVAESYPPQCDGPPVDDWSWAGQKGTYESADGVRWGAYSVGGTWDGARFTATDAITAALYDPMQQQEPTYPAPAKNYTDAELADIADEVRALPGALSSSDRDGRVHVDVIYDDGSLQDWAAAEYGDGVVVVTSMLVELED